MRHGRIALNIAQAVNDTIRRNNAATDGALESLVQRSSDGIDALSRADCANFGKGGWKTFPGVTTANWLAMRDGKRSSYVIGSGVKDCETMATSKTKFPVTEMDWMERLQKRKEIKK